jgi:hypothetical protein
MSGQKHESHEKMPGIPRTHSAAKKLVGYRKSKHSYESLSSAFKSHFVKLADAGARAGSYCGAVTSPENENDWLVCYKDRQGSCEWVEIPKHTTIPPTKP